MPETGEQSRATVVFHYPPDSLPESLDGDIKDALPHVEYYRATTTHGEHAYVSSADDFRTVVRHVMDNAAKIPQAVEVSALPESAIADGIVDMRYAMTMKQRGATTPNGTFDTVISMSSDLESMAVGEPATTDTAEGDSDIDPDVWFDRDGEPDSDGDELVDSATTEEDREEPAEEPATDSAVPADTLPEDVNTPAEEPLEDVSDDAEEHAEPADGEEPPVDNREVVVSHLVNRVVPAQIDGNIDAPFEAVIDRDLTEYPVQVRTMIQTLVRQANTLYQHSCSEALADIGLLTDADIDAEKSALVQSFLDTPTETVSEYLDAIVHRDGLVTSVKDELEQITKEFQRREDDWVEEKVATLMPRLRQMFRESYPTTEEAEHQSTLDEAKPALDGADDRVETAERYARSDVALRLRHQSTAGRHLSQIAGLTDVRVAMQDDLAQSIHGVLDAYEEEARLAQAQPVEPDADIDSDVDSDDLVDSETDGIGADADLIDSAEDTDPEPATAHRVDLSELIDNENSTEPDATATDDEVDYGEEDSDALVDSYESADEPDFDDEDSIETQQFDAVNTEADADVDTEAPDAGDANHPSNGDGHGHGGDSSTLNWQGDTTDEVPSPDTDPATGEALDFEEDSEIADHEHDTTGKRTGIRRFFGRFGRNR